MEEELVTERKNESSASRQCLLKSQRFYTQEEPEHRQLNGDACRSKVQRVQWGRKRDVEHAFGLQQWRVEKVSAPRYQYSL